MYFRRLKYLTIRVGGRELTQRKGLGCAYRGPRVAASTHMVAPSHLSFQFQGTQYSLGASWVPSTHVTHRHMCSQDTHAQKTKHKTTIRVGIFVISKAKEKKIWVQ